jgi:hypothetical protein
MPVEPAGYPVRTPFFYTQSTKRALQEVGKHTCCSLFWRPQVTSLAGGIEMTREEEEAQAELRRIVEALKKVRSQLRDIAAALPSTLEEAMYAEEDPDVATEVRSIIECVLTDQIGPAVRDLAAAAEYRRKERDEP